jgi:hypothetical protein
MKLVDQKLEQWILNTVVRSEVRTIIIEEMNDIKYRVWLGDIPIDVDGTEELSLEVATELVKDWSSLGYDDIKIEQIKKV